MSSSNPSYACVYHILYRSILATSSIDQVHNIELWYLQVHLTIAASRMVIYLEEKTQWQDKWKGTCSPWGQLFWSSTQLEKDLILHRLSSALPEMPFYLLCLLYPNNTWSIGRDVGIAAFWPLRQKYKKSWAIILAVLRAMLMIVIPQAIVSKLQYSIRLLASQAIRCIGLISTGSQGF